MRCKTHIADRFTAINDRAHKKITSDQKSTSEVETQCEGSGELTS